MDQNLRPPVGLVLSHTHFSRRAKPRARADSNRSLRRTRPTASRKGSLHLQTQGPNQMAPVLAMGQNPNRTPSEHANPTTKVDENGR